jgi:hypothetical protein
MMIVGGILLILWSDQRYPGWLMMILGTLSLLGGVIALFFLATTFGAAARDRDTMVLAGLRYIGTSAGALLITLLPALPWWATLTVIVLFLWRYRDYSLGPILAHWHTN